ncbi:MAG: TIGR02301 family protein [Candidatus Tokpelaia sp.]|nr:MAG: TIGR02301 family protein [Candidatus Tokpelaia sp.]KAA6206930.1 MAG: TIGR02301 family protein [Candidatus Tokpelaia sp.]
MKHPAPVKCRPAQAVFVFHKPFWRFTQFLSAFIFVKAATSLIITANSHLSKKRFPMPRHPQRPTAPHYRHSPSLPAFAAGRQRVFALILAAGGTFLPPSAGAEAITAPLNSMPGPATQNRSLSNYDEKLNRMAEILGSLHYLYRICGAQDSEWRAYMQKLIAALHADDKQQLRLYAAFNRSYEAFADNYSACTTAAKEASERYRLEGLTLSRHLLEHFSSDSAAP